MNMVLRLPSLRCFRPPAPTLNPKIDSGVPLRRAPVPAAGGSSLTPASPPTPEN